MTVKAATAWPTNAELIADVASLGYLCQGWRTLDPTYGHGNWWTIWRPDVLVKHDIAMDGVDFRALPHEDASFDVVAYDPPYKLNGTPTPEVDDRYGVGEPTPWTDRWELIFDGQTECTRVLKRDGYLLMKCQDQVCSGRVRWQTHSAYTVGNAIGLRLVDSFLMLGGRAQPSDRRQVHAHRNYSTLLVFQKT